MGPAWQVWSWADSFTWYPVGDAGYQLCHKANLRWTGVQQGCRADDMKMSGGQCEQLQHAYPWDVFYSHIYSVHYIYIIYLFIYIFLFIFIYLYLFLYLYLHLSSYLFICLFVYVVLIIFLFMFLFFYLFIRSCSFDYLFVCLFLIDV